jgi:hypothetical protein
MDDFPYLTDEFPITDDEDPDEVIDIPMPS